MGIAIGALVGGVGGFLIGMSVGMGVGMKDILEKDLDEIARMREERMGMNFEYQK